MGTASTITRSSSSLSPVRKRNTSSETIILVVVCVHTALSSCDSPRRHKVRHGLVDLGGYLQEGRRFTAGHFVGYLLQSASFFLEKWVFYLPLGLRSYWSVVSLCVFTSCIVTFVRTTRNKKREANFGVIFSNARHAVFLSLFFLWKNKTVKKQKPKGLVL